MTFRLTLWLPPKFILLVRAAPEGVNNCLAVILMNPGLGSFRATAVPLLTIVVKLVELLSIFVDVSSIVNLARGFTLAVESACATLTAEDAVLCW